MLASQRDRQARETTGIDPQSRHVWQSFKPVESKDGICLIVHPRLTGGVRWRRVFGKAPRSRRFREFGTRDRQQVGYGDEHQYDSGGTNVLNAWYHAWTRTRVVADRRRRMAVKQRVEGEEKDTAVQRRSQRIFSGFGMSASFTLHDGPRRPVGGYGCEQERSPWKCGKKGGHDGSLNVGKFHECMRLHVRRQYYPTR
jgi:hypothetical protein